MNATDDLTRRLVDLADRPDAYGREREELERVFAVIVRLALNQGRGIPHVVRWVGKVCDQIAGPGRAGPRLQYAPRITQLLFDRILDRIRPSADTHPRHWSESLRDD